MHESVCVCVHARVDTKFWDWAAPGELDPPGLQWDQTAELWCSPDLSLNFNE